jgi:retron-type reverse transcriptase
VLEHCGYSPAVATVLALLCTECPRQAVTFQGRTFQVAVGPRSLPQGACTSPALSNQVARRLDRRLGGLADKVGFRYTRYADDLTFSAGAAGEELIGYLLSRVRDIALSESFRMQDRKTRVLRRNRAQLVTGLVVNDRPGVRRAEIRRLRAILHRAKTEGLDAQNRADRPAFRAWLLGKIAYVKMVQPEVGARLLAEFRALTPSPPLYVEPT